MAGVSEKGMLPEFFTYCFLLLGQGHTISSSPVKYERKYEMLFLNKGNYAASNLSLLLHKTRGGCMIHLQLCHTSVSLDDCGAETLAVVLRFGA